MRDGNEIMVKQLTSNKFWNEGYKTQSASKKKTLNFRFNRSNREFKNLFHQLNRIALDKKSCLEMGCGNSLWLPFIAKNYTYNVGGIDYTEAGIQAAQENLLSHNISGKLWLADFLDETQMKRHKHRWDLIFSLGVIEHFEQPDQILKKFSKCLQQDGFILTVIPNLSGLMGSIQKKVNKKIYSQHKVISESMLISYHKQAGFHIINHGCFGFLDFSLINLSHLGGQKKRYIGRFIRICDLPLLLLTVLKINIPIAYLSSFFFVIAKKQ